MKKYKGLGYYNLTTEELIGESDYYDILKSRGINIETLNSYYASRFNKYPLFTENPDIF